MAPQAQTRANPAAPVNQTQLQRARALYASALSLDREFKNADTPTIEMHNRWARVLLASARAAHLATRQRTGNAWKDVRGIVEAWADHRAITPGKGWLEQALTPKPGDTWTDYRGNVSTLLETPVSGDPRHGVHLNSACTQLYTPGELLEQVCMDASWFVSMARDNRKRERKQAKIAALPMEIYLATLTPFKAGQARRSLEKVLRFTAGTMNRAAWCEMHAGSWWIDREGRTVDGPEMVYLSFGQLTMAAVNYLDWLQSKAKEATA